MFTSWNHTRAAELALALLLATAHPVSAAEPTTAIDGRITFNGNPLASGRIIFYVDDDQFVGTKVKDGAYKLTRVPVGAWRVAIEGEGIPARYSSEQATTLTVQVQAGRNTFDFDLRKP